MKIYQSKGFITLLIAALFFASPAWAQQGAEKTKKTTGKVIVDGREISNAISTAVCEAGKAIARATQNVKVVVVSDDTDVDIDQDEQQPQEPQDPKQEVRVHSRGTTNTGDLPYKRNKKFSKSYTISSSDQLSINNSYGKVEVIAWDKKEFKVDVEMTVSSTSESRAEELIGLMNVATAKTGNLVTFKTNFGDMSSDAEGVWGSLKKMFSGSGNYSQKLSINYTVYMPVDNALIVKNSYGSIVLPDFKGNTQINAPYSTLTTKSLSGASNKINVSYGRARIGSVNNLSMAVSYSPGSSIESLSGNTKIALTYSPNLKVLTVGKNAKDIVVNAEYSPNLVMGFDSASNLDFNVKVSYGGFKYNKAELEAREFSGQAAGYNPTKLYKGQIGKGGNGNVVITSTYGSVSFL